MPCRLDRLWHPPWLEVRTVSEPFPYRFHTGSRLRCAPSQNGPSFSRNGCPNGIPKRFKLVQILSKEVSQNDVRARPSKRTDPDAPKPWKSSSRAGASTVFTFAAMPEKMSKKLPKALPRDPKVDQKLKQNRVQQRTSNWYRFLVMFLVPKEAEMVPKAPQKAPKQAKKGSKVRSRTDSTKRFPQDLPKDPCWSVLGCVSVLFLPDFEFFL